MGSYFCTCVRCLISHLDGAQGIESLAKSPWGEPVKAWRWTGKPFGEKLKTWGLTVGQAYLLSNSVE